MVRRLEQPVSGATVCYLRKRLKHYGIDITHFADEPLPPRERKEYTKEILEAAVARSGSLRELIVHLGVRPYPCLPFHLKKRLEHFGVDTSHFSDVRRRREALAADKEALQAAVDSSRSIAETLRKLGEPTWGSARGRLLNALTRHGISIDHFTGQGHNRGRRSPNRLSAAEILVTRPPDGPRAHRALLHRALQEMNVPYRCGGCGVGDRWRGRTLVLEIDHVNGDRRDHRLENLRYLCPSCHSQTPTYCVRPSGAVGRRG
ncbi:HNH endonuclease [Streptomyces sp. JH002]|uniref:HNH endonuclease signature motif containing protein n=1 Tax=Streptomyces sp. JH002 TaxID=2763259 RepID=UPI003D805732